MFEMKNKLLGILFPDSIYCMSCGSVIDYTRSYSLCDQCIEKFTWALGKTCKKCGKPLEEDYHDELCYDCIKWERHFDKGYSCTSYKLYERMLISDFKERGRTYIAKEIATIMADRIREENLNVDLIIPVPSTKRKMKERGFNQTQLIGKDLSKKIGVRIEENLLVRRRETKPMRTLSAEARRENVKDAFSVISRTMDILHQKNILLIDDVYTTGSTMDSCGKVLKEAGAAKVYLLTFAAGANVDKIGK